MPRRYGNRNRAYRSQKRNSFSRNYTRGAPQGGAYRSRAAGREDARSPMPTLKLVLGRARVWLFNNSDGPITIQPNGGLILQIVDEFSHRLGDAFRLVVISASNGNDSNGPDFRPQDWV
jgi:hypothetical protein